MMKTVKSVLLLALAAVLFVSDSKLSAQEDEKKAPAKKIPAVEIADEPAIVIGGVKLTLGQAIQQAIRQNHDILAGSYDVAMSDTYYEKFQKKYSIFLNAEGGYKYQKYPEAAEIITGEKSKTLDGRVAVAKMFNTGTTVSGGVSHTYSMTYNPSLALIAQGFGIPADKIPGTANYNVPVLFVSVQQELLKNGFGYNERRQEKILKNIGTMQKEHIVSMLSMVVVGVIVDYWTVVINKSQLDNAELQLKETRRVRDIVARNVALGQADGFNINYYNMLTAGAEAGVLSARQKYRDSMRVFLATVNLNEEALVQGSAVMSGTLPAMNEEEALKTAYSKRADYRNALLAVENARLELQMYSGDALPSLTAELNMFSMAQYESFGGSYSDAASMKYPSVETRLKMTYPLDDREQETNERNARFKLKQARINFEKVNRSVRDDIKSKIELVNTSFELYRKAKEANIQAAAFYNKMLQSLQRGRLSSADVKNGLDAMLTSRQYELAALVYFNVSLLQYDVARNELFDKYMINVEDYIPKDKK